MAAPSGTTATFAAYIERWRGALVGRAQRRYGLSEADAEDVVQEALLRARALWRGDGEVTLWGYLTRAVSSVYADACRSNARRTSGYRGVGAGLPLLQFVRVQHDASLERAVERVAGTAPSAEEEALSRLDGTTLAVAWRTLTVGQQRVLRVVASGEDHAPLSDAERHAAARGRSSLRRALARQEAA